MPVNYGKAFESKFKEDWIVSYPLSFIYRLNDQLSGYKVVSKNICDFICFNDGILYLIECKSHNGNTFPLANLTQFDKLKEKVGIPGVRAGVILWMIDHKKVLYIPVSTFKKLKEDGKKSVNIKMLADKSYNIIEIPSTKKRVFMDSDYSCLKNLKDGE